MLSRLRHFRAAYLLVLSSALLFWIISFWLPLPEYLQVLSSKDYAPYEIPLKVFVALFLSVCLINLVIAGLFATRINSLAKFWLAIVPAVLIFLGPIVLAIPIALQFPKQNYFEVFAAMYRLFRFTKPDTFALALIFTVLAAALNIYAAILIRNTSDADKVSSKLRNRYLIYTAVVTLLVGSFVAINVVNATYRSLDRAACQKYESRELPQLDEEVPIFLSDLMLYGQSSGTSQLQSAFITFSMLSRQYYQLLDSSDDEIILSSVQAQVTEARAKVALLCSEFATD